MFENTGVAYGAGLRGRVISCFLYLYFNGYTIFGIAFGVGVGGYEGATGQRYHAILFFGSNGVYGVYPLGDLFYIEDKTTCVATMRFNRFFRWIRRLGLARGLFVWASLLNDGFRRARVYFVLLFFFGGSIGAMGYGTTVIASCATTTMDVQGAYCGITFSYGSRFINVDPGRTIIVDYSMARFIFGFVARLVPMDYTNLPYRAGATG